MIPRTGLAALLSFALLLASGGADPLRGEDAGAPQNRGGAPGPAGGFRLFETTAASVNGQVLFLSDLLRESCLVRCGAFPGDDPARPTLGEVRERLIRETLVVQEESRLGLSQVDNAAVRKTVEAAQERMAGCGDPCAREIAPGEVAAYAERRIVIREFLRKRVEVFVEVNEEEIDRAIDRQVSREGIPPGSISREEVRTRIFEEKAAREIRNWVDRATSKSRIVRSPLEEE